MAWNGSNGRLQALDDVMLDLEGADGCIRSRSDNCVLVQVCYTGYASRVNILDGNVPGGLDYVPNIHIPAIEIRISKG